MTDQITTEFVTERATAADDDLDHIVCCDDNTSFCGIDVTDLDWGEPIVPCVVCDAMDDYYNRLGICCPKNGDDDD